MSQKLISICIPTYNRPVELKRMLESIDTTKYDDVDIVISENCSLLQKETREVVEEYRKSSEFDIHYFENEENIGYDRNIRAIMQRSTGKFSMLFSDDDVFMQGAMDEFVEFVRNHQDCGYILRSYKFLDSKGHEQDCRYYASDKEFNPGIDSYIELFDKGVFLSGFTIRTEYAREYVIDDLDGSLLYQIYLAAEVIRRYPSAYSRILISKQLPNQTHFFGDSKEEKELYKTGLNGVQDRLNFATWYMKIIDLIDNKYNDSSAKRIKHYMSKYSFSIVGCGRQNYWDIKTYNQYCRELRKIGYGSSIYFYIYYLGVLLFGNSGCWAIVRFLKKVIGHRPKL